MDEDWGFVEHRIIMAVKQYEAMGDTGIMGLEEALRLKERFDSGERTEELAEEVAQCR